MPEALQHAGASDATHWQHQAPHCCSRCLTCRVSMLRGTPPKPSPVQGSGACAVLRVHFGSCLEQKGDDGNSPFRCLQAGMHRILFLSEKETAAGHSRLVVALRPHTVRSPVGKHSAELHLRTPVGSASECRCAVLAAPEPSGSMPAPPAPPMAFPNSCDGFAGHAGSSPAVKKHRAKLHNCSASPTSRRSDGDV